MGDGRLEGGYGGGNGGTGKMSKIRGKWEKSERQRDG